MRELRFYSFLSNMRNNLERNVEVDPFAARPAEQQELRAFEDRKALMRDLVFGLALDSADPAPRRRAEEP
jgi:hypothetical protein